LNLAHPIWDFPIEMRPYVIFNSTITLDGRIANKESRIMSRLEKNRIHELRETVDAIMVDVETIINENPLLDVRRGHEPYRVITDPKAEIPLNARVFESDGKKIVFVSSEAPGKKIEKLQKIEDMEVIRIGKFTVNLPDLLSKLSAKGIKRVLVEGYGSLPFRMLNENLIDEIYISISPILCKGRRLFERDFDNEIELELEGILQYGNQVVLHYTVKR